MAAESARQPGHDSALAFEALARLPVLEPYRGEEAKLLACVHCGFCLDACPTYTRLGLEPDSPRGRLYLMRAVAEGRIAADSPAFETHLDRCLGCRACEPVCPSGVQYGFLLERGRAIIASTRGTPRLERALLTTFGHRVLSRLALAGGRALRDSGVAGWLARRLRRAMPRASFALAMLEASRPWPGLRTAGTAGTRSKTDHSGSGADHSGRRPATVESPAAERLATPADSRDAPDKRTTSRTRVAVLRGCVQDGLFGRVNRATVEVLRANGCDIADAPDQVCCGALHAHGGSLDAARALALHNIDAFDRTGAERIIVNAAGCGAAMKEYPGLLSGTPGHDRAAAFARKVVDVSEFLAATGPRAGAPIALRAAWDAPCHLIHAQRIDRAPLDVMRAIPGLDVVPIPHADECCGGAGTYGLTHPNLGARILGDKLDNIRSVGADIVVTANPGCMMQIGAGLRLAGDATPVLHPIELLAESYRRRK